MFHMGWFLGTGFGVYGWNGPWTGNVSSDVGRPQLFIDMATSLERAGFDYMMLEDSSVLPDNHRGTFEASVKKGGHVRFDPLPLIPYLTNATQHIGVIATISTTFYHPFMAARVMSSLDTVTKGRVGMNLVTSSNASAMQNYGISELIPHDERYLRANEWVDIVTRLWDSWDADAVIMDEATNTFADHTKVRPIDFEGTYYRSRGPLNATPSPQGRPVIIQAGASDRGQDFAARHAEAVIVSRETVDEMKQYYDAFKARVKKQGRDPDECKVFFLTKPIIGDTDEAAQRRADELYANAPVEAGLASLSTMLQMDLSTYDIDKPLPAAIQTRAIQGIRSQLDRFYMSGRTPTLRDIATRKVSIDSKPYIGTAERVADELARTIDAVGGDGFAIRQGIWPGYVGPFVDKVIPLLQQRGAVRTEYTGTTLREHLREF
jgi:FMN-dependent oxidoreductase (nitrilotriacetate monooxygenase family)